MKNLIKLFLLILVLLLPTTAKSYDFKVDGIYYNYIGTDKWVEVTYKDKNYNSYSGSVTIPSSVKYNGITSPVFSIGDSAFLNCNELSSVTISNGIKQIEKSAFEGCPGLAHINISSSVNYINGYAFKGCTGLTHFNIPNSVDYINDCTFEGCTGLTNINIHNSVIYIGPRAFQDCYGLTSIDIPNSIRMIGVGAFVNCTGLTSVTIDDSDSADSNYMDIGSWAFSGCANLTQVSIGNSVKYIGEKTFQNCSGLTKIAIPNSVEGIGDRAFAGCTNLTSMTVAGGNPIYDSRNNCNAIIETAENTLISGCKNTIIPNTVTTIGSYAFEACTGLTSIVIPNRVTTIRMYAFDGCSGVTNIDIPNSVTSIGNNAFRGCAPAQLSWNVKNGTSMGTMTKTDITHVVIGPDVEVLPCSFVEGSKITSVLIPNSITNIEYNAFWDCVVLDTLYYNAVNCVYDYSNTFSTSISNIYIGESVQSIPSSFAYRFEKLTSVTIPSSVTGIGCGAFRGCTNLTNMTVAVGNPIYDSRDNCNAIVETASNKLVVGCKNSVIPNSVTAIGNNAFHSSGLTSIDIPNSITLIDEFAFSYSKYLKSVTIPSSVTVIGERSFDGCTDLTSLIIGNSDTIIGNIGTTIGYMAFNGCTRLKDVIMGTSVREIGTQAFSNTGLKSLDIGKSVTTIGSGAFSFCYALESVTIPASVTSMGEHVFTKSVLNNVYSYPDPQRVTMGESVFLFVPVSTCTLHVLPEYLEAYKSADQWKDFYRIVADISGLEEVSFDDNNKTVDGYYDLNGNFHSEPINGVNIVKYQDGTFKKMIISN